MLNSIFPQLLPLLLTLGVYYLYSKKKMCIRDSTGIALAIIGRQFGYKVVIVMPESMSVERRKLILSYGSELILTDKAKGMQGSIDKVNELMAANPNYYSLGQFDNPAMVQKHFDTTAVEIMNQVPLSLIHI